MGLKIPNLQVKYESDHDIPKDNSSNGLDSAAL
jgi:hypothetical protein